jgi:hypothetical protein
MYQTYHKSMTNLLKTIKAEDLKQFSVLVEDKETEVDGKIIITQEYALARPWPVKVENKE